MGRIWEWIKKHPLTIVLIVGGIVLLLLLMGGGGGSTQQAQGSNAPSDAEVAAAASTQQAQIAAGAAANQTAAQLAATTLQTNASVQEAAIQAASQNYQVQQQAGVSEAGIAAQQTVQEAGIASQVQLADIAAHSTDLQTQAQVAIAANNAQTYADITNAQAETQQTAIEAAAAVQLAPYQLESNVAGDVYNTLGQKGLLQAVQWGVGTKDAVLNLPGLSAMRATNFAPAGATPNPSSTGAIVQGATTGLSALLAFA